MKEWFLKIKKIGKLLARLNRGKERTLKKFRSRRKEVEKIGVYINLKMMNHSPKTFTFPGLLVTKL
jgi:hypothetical protein